MELTVGKLLRREGHIIPFSHRNSVKIYDFNIPIELCSGEASIRCFLSTCNGNVCRKLRRLPPFCPAPPNGVALCRKVAAAVLLLVAPPPLLGSVIVWNSVRPE